MQPAVCAQFLHTICANLEEYAVHIRDLSAAGVVGRTPRNFQCPIQLIKGSGDRTEWPDTHSAVISLDVNQKTLTGVQEKWKRGEDTS